jgi:putative salt-induced outer membrane protein YdiY
LESGVTYFSEVLSFTNDMIVFPSFTKIGNLKLRNETSLETRLTEGWSLNLSHILDYNNDAPEVTGASDYMMTFGLQHEF